MRPASPQRFRRWARPLALGVVLFVALAGCAGSTNDGGGNGSSEYTLYVLLVNRHTEAHVLSYSGGAALPGSPDEETAESCSAIIVHYPVVVPFEILVDDLPVIISDELEFGVPQDGETNMIATLEVGEDGVAVPVIGDSSGGSPVAAGTSLSKPAALGICN
jgi:hypothetical protein